MLSFAVFFINDSILFISWVNIWIFFSILKTKCIYRHRPKTFREANDLVDRYIHFYNYERIQNKTAVAPLTLRHCA